jgi:type II secretory pathway component PulM
MGSWTEREPRLRWLLFGVCVILVLQVIWFLLLLPFGWQHKGQIGDLFGGLNTFFTGLERVMNSIRIGLEMGKTEVAKEPSRPWNPHFYAVFAQVHNTL